MVSRLIIEIPTSSHVTVKTCTDSHDMEILCPLENVAVSAKMHKGKKSRQPLKFKKIFCSVKKFFRSKIFRLRPAFRGTHVSCPLDCDNTDISLCVTGMSLSEQDYAKRRNLIKIFSKSELDLQACWQNTQFESGADSASFYSSQIGSEDKHSSVNCMTDGLTDSNYCSSQIGSFKKLKNSCYKIDRSTDSGYSSFDSSHTKDIEKISSETDIKGTKQILQRNMSFEELFETEDSNEKVHDFSNDSKNIPSDSCKFEVTDDKNDNKSTAYCSSASKEVYGNENSKQYDGIDCKAEVFCCSDRLNSFAETETYKTSGSLSDLSSFSLISNSSLSQHCSSQSGKSFPFFDVHSEMDITDLHHYIHTKEEEFCKLTDSFELVKERSLEQHVTDTDQESDAENQTGVICSTDRQNHVLCQDNAANISAVKLIEIMKWQEILSYRSLSLLQESANLLQNSLVLWSEDIRFSFVQNFCMYLQQRGKFVKTFKHHYCNIVSSLLQQERKNILLDGLTISTSQTLPVRMKISHMIEERLNKSYNDSLSCKRFTTLYRTSVRNYEHDVIEEYDCLANKHFKSLTFANPNLIQFAWGFQSCLKKNLHDCRSTVTTISDQLVGIYFNGNEQKEFYSVGNLERDRTLCFGHIKDLMLKEPNVLTKQRGENISFNCSIAICPWENTEISQIVRIKDISGKICGAGMSLCGNSATDMFHGVNISLHCEKLDNTMKILATDTKLCFKINKDLIPKRNLLSGDNKLIKIMSGGFSNDLNITMLKKKTNVTGSEIMIDANVVGKLAAGWKTISRGCAACAIVLIFADQILLKEYMLNIPKETLHHDLTVTFKSNKASERDGNFHNLSLCAKPEVLKSDRVLNCLPPVVANSGVIFIIDSYGNVMPFSQDLFVNIQTKKRWTSNTPEEELEEIQDSSIAVEQTCINARCTFDKEQSLISRGNRSNGNIRSHNSENKTSLQNKKCLKKMLWKFYKVTNNKRHCVHKGKVSLSVKRYRKHPPNIDHLVKSFFKKLDSDPSLKMFDKIETDLIFKILCHKFGINGNKDFHVYPVHRQNQPVDRSQDGLNERTQDDSLEQAPSEIAASPPTATEEIEGLDIYFHEMEHGPQPTLRESMRFEWMRLKSYWSFPANIGVSPVILARWGFYYTGHCGETRCFCCTSAYREWEDGDNVETIHRRISPSCPFLLGTDLRNVPISRYGLPRLPLAERPEVTQTSGDRPEATQTSADLSSRTPEGISEAAAARDIEHTESSTSRSKERGPGFDQANFLFTARPPATTTEAKTTDKNTSTTVSQTNVAVTSSNRQTASSITTGITSVAGTATASVSAVTTTVSTAATATPSTPAATTAGTPSTASTTATATPSTPATTTAGTPSTPATTSASSSASGNIGPSGNTVATTTSSTVSSANQTRSSTTTSSSQTSASNSAANAATHQRYDPLGINFDRPRYPSYSVIANRSATFGNWPTYLRTPKEMSTAGFFYAGYGDYVRCFFCGGGLRNWEPGDDPWVEHARWFPRCAFVRMNKGDTFVNTVLKRQEELDRQRTQGNETHQVDESAQGATATPPKGEMDSSAVKAIMEMGVQDEEIEKALKIFHKKQKRGKKPQELSATILMHIILDELDTSPTTEEPPSASGGDPQPIATTSTSEVSGARATAETAETQPSGSSNTDDKKSSKSSSKAKSSEGSEKKQKEKTTQEQVQPTTENEARGEEKDDDLEELQTENAQLRDQLLCKICCEKNVSVAFLPCGHLVCCEDCAPAMRKCPVCRDFIRGTVKTFFP